jgi:hypothetical protein
MTPDTEGGEGARAADQRQGDPRQADRRANDRRNLDRRAPPPWWRRPWALVSYGVLGALLVVALFRGGGGDDEPNEEVVAAAPAAPPAQQTPPPAAGAPAQDAFRAADFEALSIQGAAAQGRRVRTQLYCGAPSPIALREQVQQVEAAVVALRDTQGRVPAAECQWGGQGEERRQEFLLLIPPELAEAFAAQPVTTDEFVERRRVVAEVEWIGRSPALSLRTAGVLRRVYPR